LKLPNPAAIRRQSPYTRNSTPSRTANQKFGPLREPAQLRSPEAEPWRNRDIVDLSSIECADMNPMKVGICHLFTICRNSTHVNRIINGVGCYLTLDYVWGFIDRVPREQYAHHDRRAQHQGGGRDGHPSHPQLPGLLDLLKRTQIV